MTAHAATLYETLIGLGAFTFVGSITPGPNNLMLMTSGTNFGFRRSIPHILGVGIGFALMVALVGLGLAELFRLYPVAQQILKWVSVAYLCYLAWKIATAKPPSPETLKAGARPLTFLQAASFQWVNPKAWTMALTALSAYLPPINPYLGLILVAGLVGVINIPCITCWNLLGVQLRRFLGDPVKLRVFNIGMALLLLASLYPTLR
jgi:threonine/homoserine/homoserine lactone efflux protein